MIEIRSSSRYVIEIPKVGTHTKTKNQKHVKTPTSALLVINGHSYTFMKSLYFKQQNPHTARPPQIHELWVKKVHDRGNGDITISSLGRKFTTAATETRPPLPSKKVATHPLPEYSAPDPPSHQGAITQTQLPVTGTSLSAPCSAYPSPLRPNTHRTINIQTKRRYQFPEAMERRRRRRSIHRYERWTQKFWVGGRR